MSLEAIEQLVKEYADARGRLTFHVEGLQREIEIVKKRRRKTIRNFLNRAAEAEALLRTMIEDSPECFKRPKTHIFHGIKVGYKKSKGSLTWDNADLVIKLIRKHFPELADTLIRSKPEPNKQALGEMPAKDLKRLGVRVEEDGEVVLVKPTEGDIEKVVNALIKEAVDNTEAA